MRLSKYFFTTLKEVPADAQIISHRLMLRSGMVNQTASGIYTWLPLGHRVLEKIIKIISEEQDRVGFHHITMPTIQPASLWVESGRYNDYGKEMLRIQDRHERELLYGPTHEEVITDIGRQYIKSYKQLPQVMYQVHWKFRDEIRPRFGVMRGREFLMKDGYSFDLTYDDAKKTYEKVFESYLRTFARMGLTAIPVRADSGAIGGDLSHEFQIVAPTGESTIYYDAAFEEITEEKRTYQHIKDLYAAADEKHSEKSCPVEKKNLKTSRGIEIGHIFYFGTKYSKAMNFSVVGPDGQPIYPEMGSYGIGASRLVAAIIEASHDDSGIIWPEEVAPYKVALINTRANDDASVSAADIVYDKLIAKGIEVLYDDRNERAGAKFADMDLIGIPYQIIVGRDTLENGTYELKIRKTGERFHLAFDDVMTRFS
jgi:prolyl-tRNA synthetase